MAEQWAAGRADANWPSSKSRRPSGGAGQTRQKISGQQFANYFHHAEPVARAPSHRLLAMICGEAEGMLHVGVQLQDEVALDKFKRQLV